MTKRMLLALMAMAGVAIATYLTLYKTGAIGELVCTVGSCETVNTSKWSVFLGFPVAAWGLAFYVLLLAVTLAGVQDRWSSSLAVSRALVGLTAWGVLFSGWLTYLELFVIHAICVWCVTSAVLVAAMFAVSLLEYREQVAAQR
ncbi:MAG: vitamin K epoxide reductase family protein [Gemmatimonadaceae bacterium]